MLSYNKVRNYNKERSLRIWELAALLAANGVPPARKG